VALVSGVSSELVQHAFTRSSEHSLPTFREKYLVFLSSSSVIINAVNLTMGRVRASGLGIESRWGEIFLTRPDRPWGPLSHLYNGNRVFSGGKAAGAWL